MAESPHYKELLHIFNTHGVEYLIVGGYAVMKYTEPRYTKDLDVWVRNSPPNARQLFEALSRFGAPLHRDGITPETFRKEKVVYQIGVAPVRIDISTHIDGVRFATAWRKRSKGTLFGIPANFISRSDLIRNKHATGRSADVQDLEYLEKTIVKKRRSRSRRSPAIRP